LLLYSTRVTDGAGESENEASSSICKAHIGQILGQPENEQAAMPDSTIEQDDGGRCACLSGRLYLPLEALGVDAEGRLGVFPGREPRELLRRVVVARGGGGHEAREDEEARNARLHASGWLVRRGSPSLGFKRLARQRKWETARRRKWVVVTGAVASPCVLTRKTRRHESGGRFVTASPV
jgi:hypothetical protein